MAMFGSYDGAMRLPELEQANARTLAHTTSVRPVSTGEIIRVHRKKYPYRGYVEIDSPYANIQLVRAG
jgi:hypothetical protein